MPESTRFRSASSAPSGDYSLVVGLGASGLAAARHLAASGESVLVIDSRDAPPGLASLERDNPEIRIVLNSLESKWLDHATRVVLSPGLSVNHPLVAAARSRGIEITGELELFARQVRAPVIAITGSNGKSTVTTLCSELLTAQGLTAPAGGNLGPPALELLDLGPVDAYVIEISSFQLETLTSLRPLAAALLNISADHIDRHGSLEVYAALKASLLDSATIPVVNWDDPLVRALAPQSDQTVHYSVREPLAHGFSVVEHAGERWLADRLQPLIPSAALGLRGQFGEANALAALALAQSLGGDLSAAISALVGFRGLPHRLQLVGEIRGVRYIDDSKGTNVGATLAALASEPGPAVLIAGGQSKGADFGPLANAAAEHVRAAILIGEAAEELERVLEGRTETHRADSIETAVSLAATLAEPGDRVLLSPACASQDMFVDYKARGRAFAAAVEELSS